MREIRLSGKRGYGLIALVDDDDFERLSQHRWYALHVKGSRTVYARTVVDGLTVYMHHMVKKPMDGLEIDHEDRNGLNNQSANLRELSHALNVANGSPLAGVTNVQANRSKGKTYYYHRPTRTRLPDDPTSAEFAEILKRLNAEQKLENVVQRCVISST